MKKISIGILTYNHEDFIEQCLRSVLSSAYPHLEIIISDDASKDKTTEVIDRVLASVRTSHTIVFNKNKVNVGLACNFNKTFGDLSSGDFFITLGGDDVISEDYFEKAIRYFENDPQLMMLDFTADIIDETSQIIEVAPRLGYDIKYCELTDYIAVQSIPSFAPGRIIRKELVQQFEPISGKCPTEDSVLVLRALLLGKFARVARNVILYRRHSNNISGHANMQRLSNASIIAQYLKDAVYLYNHDGLTVNELGYVLDRINFEYHRREYIYGGRKTLWSFLHLQLSLYLYQKRYKKSRKWETN